MSVCLDDRAVAAMVSGTLRDGEREQAAAHLDACDTCRDLVAEAALAVGADDAPGYRLGAEVARGAMGRVIAAHDLRLGREVAVKQLLDVSPALRRRFEREVTLTAGLQHPGIVPVYQAGVLAGGEPFYAMRRVHGRALDVVIAEATTPAERLALVPRFLAAAEAVAYAHSQGVIHRDLKPHNVLVGDFGEVVVIDWGLAKRLGDDEAPEPTDDAAPADAALTRRGAILGTPAYMAPEQAEGKPADARADVYALGAVLYHLLAGVPPHAGGTVTATLADARAGRVVPLAERAPGVPPDLGAIVERAMATDPAARYRDAGALAGDARTFLAGKLVAAHDYTRWELAARWLRRHRAWVAAAAVVTVALLVIGGASLLRVRAERDRARTQQAASERMVGFMLDELRPPLENVGKLSLLAGAGNEVDRYYTRLHASGIAPGRDGLMRWGSALLLLGDVAYDGGDLAQAEAHYDRARLAWERAARSGGDADAARAKIATAHDRLGDVARERGETEAAGRAASASLAIREALRTPDHAALAMSHIKLGDLARLAGDSEAALARYQLADREQRAAEAGAAEPSGTLVSLSARLGAVREDLGQLDEARAAYEAHLALARARSDAQPDDPSRLRTLALAHSYLAGNQTDRGEVEAAIVSYQTSRDLHAALVERDPDNFTWRSSLATTLGHLGSAALMIDREADAEAADARELELWQGLSAGDPANLNWRGSLAHAHYHVALGERRGARLAAAAASVRAAIDIARPLATDDATVADQLCAYLGELNDVERERGEHAASLAAADDAITLARRWNETSPGPRWLAREADLLWGKSRTARELNDRPAAIAALRAARSRYRDLAAIATLTALQDATRREVDKDLAALGEK